jgi:hypothetical protein
MCAATIIAIVLAKFSSPSGRLQCNPLKENQRFGETGSLHERRPHLQEWPNELFDDRDSNNVAAQSFLAA